MSWDNVWPLPRAHYTRDEIEQAVTKAAAEFGARRLPDEPYEDWEENESDDGSLAFTFAIPRKLLVEYGDRPGAADEYECVFTVAQNILGDDSERWEVCVHSNDAGNREANMAISHLAARVSVLLGGPDEPEEL